MGRPPCCDKDGIKKGPWTPEEDIILVSYIQQHGPANWRAVPTNTGLQRCSKSCRLRWTNYLRPGIKRGNFTPHEEGMIIHLQALLGNKWAAIASYLPQRTDNDIKNYWNTHLKKKLKRFQPTSHQDHPHNIATTNTKLPSSSNNNEFNQTDHPNTQQSPLSSCYASSTENISRLLENWMKNSSTSRTIAINAEGNDIGNGDGDTISLDHEEDEFAETTLSSHNLNNDNITPTMTSTTITWDTMEGNLNEGRNVNGAQHIDEDDDHNPPLSCFLEKWFLDETNSSRHAAEDMLELPSFFSL
ncbi:hypothetical protein KSS87_013889 [Heliosperma pusillum]|nr:hypothetical protein KSS87_013889 [Heliosperma pusillum]